jgi:hypothetical protein
MHIEIYRESCREKERERVELDEKRREEKRIE